MGALAFAAGTGAVHAGTNANLSNEDCAKCHPNQVNDLAAAGGSHKAVSCSGCHIGHPPEVKKPITPCSKCHSNSRKNHYDAEMRACLNCHTNPHKPMNNISLKGADRDACLICHGPEVWFFREFESKHSAVECSRCHDVHRKIPHCARCHKPHPDIADDCHKCHKGHRPKIEAYSASTPSVDCGVCHKSQSSLLGASAAKHKNLACIGCHKLKHKFKPDCEDCHGTPHPKGFRIKFPECGMCHGSAHDLNNWPAEPETAAGKTPGKQK